MMVVMLIVIEVCEQVVVMVREMVLVVMEIINILMDMKVRATLIVVMVWMVMLVIG